LFVDKSTLKVEGCEVKSKLYVNIPCKSFQLQAEIEGCDRRCI